MQTAKRHYRVAERNKELQQEACTLTPSHLKQLSCLGLCVYILSLILSISLGYFIGKNQSFH